MNKRYFLLHLVLSLGLTTQVYAQDAQTPSIIFNPAIFDFINNDSTTVTPDRTNTVNTDATTPTDTTNVAQNPDDTSSTVGTPEETNTEQPTSTEEETPEILGPGVERPVYTLEPVGTTVPPTTTTPTRPTRPTRPTIPETPTEQPTQPEEEPVENCPLFNPLDQNPVKCPESKPIIPVLPIMMVVGPLGGLLLFFFIFKFLQNSHLKTETRLEQKRQHNLTNQRNSDQQQKTYQDYLSFLSSSLTEPTFNQTEFLKQQAQLELFGSEKMLKLHQQIGTAFQQNNHQEIKALLPALITQIRLEE